MAVKGYVFFTMSDYAKGQLMQEKPEWLPQVEGVTTELLTGPYDGVFIVEAPDLRRLGEIVVDFIANNPAMHTCSSCIVIREFVDQVDSTSPTPQKGG